MNYMWWGKQELELQDWEGCIKSNKNRILSIVMLVTNNNTPGYKEHVIYFIAFAFGKGVTIIDLIANIKLYVSDNEESYNDTIIGNMGNAGISNFYYKWYSVGVHVQLIKRIMLYLLLCTVQE